MPCRLLVDLEVVGILQGLTARKRSLLLAHFQRIEAAPDSLSDYHERDAVGRRVEISVFAGFAIHYWIDFADRHVKVLALRPADA